MKPGVLPTMFVSLGTGTWLVRRMLRARRRLDFQGRPVVITGGSRGLGLVLASVFADEGARLTLLARDDVELERARAMLVQRGAEVQTIVCDVRDQDEVQAAVARVIERYGRIDVLVNDAGVIQVGPLDHMQVADFHDSVAVHTWGPLYTTFAALPHMRQQGGGRIVNISSVGGKVAVPHLLPYCTGKFALGGMSEGMRSELVPDNILVTTVYPGLMRTGSPFNARFKGQHRDEFAWFSIGDALPIASIDAYRAARQIVEACRYGRPQLIITFQARLLVLFQVLFPNLMADVLALVNRFLPGAAGAQGDTSRSGWASQSRFSPSVLTKLSDRAAEVTNSLRGRSPTSM